MSHAPTKNKTSNNKNFSRSLGLLQLNKSKKRKRTQFLKNISKGNILLQNVIYIVNIKVTEISYPQS